MGWDPTEHLEGYLDREEYRVPWFTGHVLFEFPVHLAGEPGKYGEIRTY
jgi:hypothetical protein